MTVRSLVEHGTYEIDEIVGQPTWDSIDMVQHKGRDGQKHLYSSKPPLLATLVAGEYWLLHKATGKTLGTHPYELGRFLIFTINVIPFALMLVLLAGIAERLGTTDFGRIFVIATAALGTSLDRDEMLSKLASILVPDLGMGAVIDVPPPQRSSIRREPCDQRRLDAGVDLSRHTHA